MSQRGESQGSLLEEVGAWSVDTCRARLSETLPKLICQYCNGGSTSSNLKTTVLRLMVDSFVPLLNLQNLEEQFFEQVLPQMCRLFDEILSKASTAVKDVPPQEDGINLKEKLQTLLKISLDMLECLASCVSHVIATLSGGALSIDRVRSLPCSVLHVVKESFLHCKDSTTSYGDHFPLVSEILSSLFKKAYSLQKSLTVLLDLVQLTSEDGDECIEIVAKLCEGFHNLCVVISNMDSTLLVSTWRFLVKTTCKHKELLKNVLQIHPIITTLCSDIKSNYELCLHLAPHPPSSDCSQGGDEKTFGKTVKICALCIKMLMHIIKEFDGYLGPCHKSIYDLLLVLQSLAPPSIHAPTIFSGASEEIERSLTVCVEPLLQQLLSDLLFRDVVMVMKQDISSSLQFGRLLMLVKILQNLPLCCEETRIAWMVSSTASWEEPRDSILQAIFKTYNHCYVELAIPLKLPIVVIRGQPQQDVSLREFITVHVCGFVASVSARQFGSIESCLLENVISSNVNSALLAMDVWCFLARYGTANLCRSHVHLIADLVTSVPANHSTGYMHLSMLLWRLIPLMAQEHQDEFLNIFPPTEHPAVWSHFPLPALHENKRGSVARNLVVHALMQCETWMNTEGHTVASLRQLESSLLSIANVYAQCEGTNPPISTQLKQNVTDMVVKLWQVLPLDQIKSHGFPAVLIVITGLILSELPAADLQKVIKDLCSLLESASLRDRLEIVNLLYRARRVKIQRCPQLTGILNGLAKLFADVLADKNCPIRQLALQAFSAFAEETVHETVVPQCLCVESTQHCVVNFLNKIPQECKPEAKTEVEWLQQQTEQLLNHLQTENVVPEARPHFDNVIIKGYVENNVEQGAGWIPDGTARDKDEGCHQPAAKRAKVEDIDEEYRQVVTSMQSGLHRLKELMDEGQRSPLPWLIAELKTLQYGITELIQE